MKRIDVFTARYCGTCRALKRTLSDFQLQQPEVLITYIDVDLQRTLARKMKVDVLPTLIFYTDNDEYKRLYGSVSIEELQAAISKENS